ncbi:endo-beta-N-acetylglucosaminidase [Aquisphaera insulae]|uniref:endo-beta-N-acetylglucosaminidase n=1 Tax=Aquisphaera insulae TaxID=2712864 RepID=UPI0013EBA7E7|nr:hypothetical protein [Aquisphaera insulae]
MNYGNSTEPFEPYIQPITSVDDFYRCPDGLDWVTRACVARVPRAERIPLSSYKVASSMAGFDNGEWVYDHWFTKWCQGGHGTSPDGNRTAANVYNFSYWQYLDICYYFGGDTLLTIPPTVWTNAAHKNGVDCLATLNLDSLLNGEDPGKPGYDQSVLKFVQDKDNVALRMHAIANYFKFDGYLMHYEAWRGAGLNHEKIGECVCGIMKQLSTAGANKLKILWYDSKISGNGEFQNRLTNSARKFFEDAGHFQSNYSWGPAYEKESENYPKESGQLARSWGRPKNDVTMMMDCYRKTEPYYHKDKNGNYKDVFFSALGCVTQGSPIPTSSYTGLGCYAPGWTLFRGVTENDKKLRDRERFHQNDRAFWTGSAKFQRDKGPPDFEPDGEAFDPHPDQFMERYLELRSVVRATPFVTTFNTGEGDFYNVDGRREADTPWNNLSDQSVLPTWQVVRHARKADGKAELDYGDAFTGGSRLLITGTAEPNGGFVAFWLYKTDVTATGTQTLSLTVRVEESSNLLISGMLSFPQGEVKEYRHVGTNGWTQVDLKLPTQYIGMQITAVGISIRNGGTSSTNFSCSLGKLALLDSATMPQPPQNRCLSPDRPGGMLNWSDKCPEKSHYRIWGNCEGLKKHLLGVAYNSVYSTYQNIFNTRFHYTDFSQYTVQEVNAAGQSQDVDLLVRPGEGNP